MGVQVEDQSETHPSMPAEKIGPEAELTINCQANEID